MRVIAIDPGYDRCGIAILEGTAQQQKIMYSECFQTSSSELFHKRIFDIGERISLLIKEYQPTDMAIEDLFFSSNTKTAMKVGQARGVIIFQGVKNNLTIHEYTPNQIKVAVTGYGRATKDDVQKMVSQLISLEERSHLDDEIDAIATGITCMVTR